MPRNKPWSREELILALNLYFKIGASYKTHPEVIELSEVLNQLSDATGESDAARFRNPSGVAMKLGNFARLDSNYSGAGLTHGNKLEPIIWDEFSSNRDHLVSIASEIGQRLQDAEEDGIIVVQKVGRGRGQEFAVCQDCKRAVELRAMKLATNYYEAAGYTVTDVSGSASYDLNCNMAGIDLHTEVKGTTGDGEKVLLTPNEVEHARRYSPVSLFIVDTISVIHSSKGDCQADGGKPFCLEPWDIEKGELNPVGYSYKPDMLAISMRLP